jgi:hypothetical protein
MVTKIKRVYVEKVEICSKVAMILSLNGEQKKLKINVEIHNGLVRISHNGKY